MALKSVYCKAIKVTMEFNFHISTSFFFCPPPLSILMLLFETASAFYEITLRYSFLFQSVFCMKVDTANNEKLDMFLCQDYKSPTNVP